MARMPSRSSDMPAEAVAPALLPADEGVFCHHHRRDVFEAHRRLVHRHFKNLAQPVSHAGGGHRLDDGAALAAHLQQVEAEQGKDLELGDEVALFIDDAHAVGIAIGSQADVGLLLFNRRRQPVEVTAIGSGRMPGKSGLRSLFISISSVVPPPKQFL